MDKSVMQNAEIVANLMFRKCVSVGSQKQWGLVLQGNDSAAFIHTIAAPGSAY